MLLKQEQVSPCEVELEIQIEAERVGAAFDDTYTELGKRANIPGFRKGKAPRALLEQFLDREAVRDRAANKLIREEYPKTLDEIKLEPFAPADVEMVKMELGEPMVFKAKVPLPPKVELGDYVGLEIERRVPEVTDEDVDDQIRRMLDRQARHEHVTDRPVREGDVVLVETKDQSKPDDEPRRRVARIGENLRDFDNGVLGMATDEEKTIEITYPDDYGDDELKGKTVPVYVKVIEINERHVPELTDDWVKTTFARDPEEGTEPDPDAVDTVEKLRSRIRMSMEKAAHDAAEESVRDQVVRKVVENAEVCFPEVMVEEAVENRLEDLLDSLKKRKATLDDYLQYKNVSIEDLRKDYADESREILRNLLVLEEVGLKESIKAEDADIEAAIEAMAEEQGVPVPTINAYLDRTEGRGRLQSRVTRKKVVDFLVHASNIKNVAGQEAAGGSESRRVKKSRS